MEIDKKAKLLLSDITEDKIDKLYEENSLKDFVNIMKFLTKEKENEVDKWLINNIDKSKEITLLLHKEYNIGNKWN